MVTMQINDEVVVVVMKKDFLRGRYSAIGRISCYSNHKFRSFLVVESRILILKNLNWIHAEISRPLFEEARFMPKVSSVLWFEFVTEKFFLRNV